MSDDPSGWSLTESDPQVFTQLLRDLGVKGLQVDDLYSLDADTLRALQPIHALIFLFKHVGYDNETTAGGVEVDPLDTGVWFANQVINNSCGTLAALNAVMNIPPQASEHEGEAIEVGDELGTLKEFGAGMSALDLGHIISSHDRIRTVHNSFSASVPFSTDGSAASSGRKKADAYHFVTYLPVNGVLYELDGLRPAPLMHAAVDDAPGAWTEVARETIEARIGTYPAGSLMFNLLAIRSDPIPRLQRQMAQVTIPTQERLHLSDQLEHEQSKASKGRLENTLRQHNLLPVVFELFKALGQSGGIDKAIEDARVKGRERRERAAAKGEDDDE